MPTRSCILVCAVSLVLVVPAPAQNGQSGNEAAISFTRDWPKGQPAYYKIVVRPDGSADYSSEAAPGPETGSSATAGSDSADSAEPSVVHIRLSEAARAQIFALAQQANFFNGNFNYDKHKVADTGAKTLSYSDSTRHYQTTYNWSENDAIDDLTHLFEGISLTLESGEQLRHLMRFDKLGLNAQLAGMEQAASSGQMREIQLIAPVLKEIASNSAYMHIAQQRARDLLALSTR